MLKQYGKRNNMLNERNCLKVVSCRTASTRLPAKAFLPIGGEPSIIFLLNRLRNLSHLVLATSSLPTDDLLTRVVMKQGFIVHRGENENVFERLRSVAIQSKLPYIVRITGDCPLVDEELVRITIDKAMEYQSQGIDWDLASTKGQTPPGLDVEIIKVEAMERIKSEIDSIEQEHVTLGFLNRPDSFKICKLDIPLFKNFNGSYLLDEFFDFIFLASEIEEDKKFLRTRDILEKINNHLDFPKNSAP